MGETNHLQTEPTIAERLDWVARRAGIGLILGLAVVLPLTGNVGWDFSGAFRVDALSGEYGTITFNPWPTYWLLYPFAILPLRWGGLLWGLTNALGYIYALRRLGGHPLLLAISLPCLWTFIAGQMEGVLTLGFALALTASSGWAGLGLVLLSFKPQFGLLPALYILLTRRDWRLLVVPILVYGLSLLRWGMWIDDWLIGLPFERPGYLANLPNTSLYPYALVLIPLLFIFRELNLWMIIQTLIFPYFAIYSFAAPLAREWPVTGLYVVVASWAMTAAYYLGLSTETGIHWMAVVMVSALIVELWQIYRRRRAKRDLAGQITSPPDTLPDSA